MFAYEPILTSNRMENRRGGNIFYFERMPGHYQWSSDRDRFRIHLDYVVDNMHSDVFSRDTLRLMEARITNRERTEIKQQTGEDVTDLHDALNYTETKVGSATLLRSLVNPPTDLEYSRAKQESVRELQSDNNLRNSIEGYIARIKQRENELFYFLNGEINTGRGEDPYKNFRDARDVGVAIANAAKNIPTPESSYLASLVQELRDYGETNIHKMMRGPIYRTWSGIHPSEDVHILEPRMRYIPSQITGITVLPTLGMAYLGTQMDTPDSKTIFALGTVATGFFLYVSKPDFDNSVFIRPLMRKSLADDSFLNAVDAYGKLDELLSFVKYAKDIGHETTLPDLIESPTHRFHARGIKNPILAKEMRDFVPNDLDLEGLTFITGPNSGGKTTICKTIMQSQVMAQIGMPIVAESAQIGMMLRGAYQAPLFDKLENAEGRFGTELAQTRDIFYAMLPQGLGIFDELSEGTTFGEKMDESRKIMNGFYALGSNTILVTHNHELAKEYQEKGIGQFLQVEFDGENPTHRLIPGISTKSHADRVARKIGFGHDDIDAHLRNLVSEGIIPAERLDRLNI